jgi:cell division septation protein DedD
MKLFRVAAAVVLSSTIAVRSGAQASRPGATHKAIDAAMRLAKAGNVVLARDVIDSLIASASPDTPEFSEALFARATLASSVLDATLDYERVINSDSSRFRRESLLRLAQRALISGDAAKALEYLKKLAHDYQSDSSLATAGYWTAKALLESHDVVAACATNREAASHSRASSFFIAPLEAQARASCSAVPVPGLSPVQPTPSQTLGSTRTPSENSSGRMYAVQVAAYDVRADAEQMSQRLRNSGLEAHVDGERRPFRVRIGRFTSRADAVHALRDLKARKLDGFVTVIDQ